LPAWRKQVFTFGDEVFENEQWLQAAYLLAISYKLLILLLRLTKPCRVISFSFFFTNS